MREDKDKKLELSNFILFFLFEKNKQTKNKSRDVSGGGSLHLRGSFNWLLIAKLRFLPYGQMPLFEVSLQSTRMKMKQQLKDLFAKSSYFHSGRTDLTSGEWKNKHRSGSIF